MSKRLLIPSAALLWGLLYLRVMLACGILTLALAAVLAATASLPIAVLALIALGGPAGVGSSLLFAHLKHSGARPSDVVNTRPVVSFAWVAGPPLATFLISSLGNRAVLFAIAAVAAANIVTTWIMMRHTTRTVSEPDPKPASGQILTAGAIVIISVFIVLQATNSVAVSIMSLFVVSTLGLNVIWAGVALGVAAALEIPALLLVGRLQGRVSNVWLIGAGSVVGIAYYAGMAVVSGPVLLLALQVLNAAFFAVVAGVGLALFQEIIPRPGLATGLYTNTRRLGAIASGFIIGLGSAAFGYRGVFAACAVFTVGALIVVAAMLRTGWRSTHRTIGLEPRST